MKFSDVAVLKGNRRTCKQCGSSWFVDSYLEAKSRIQGAVGDLASLGSSGVTRMAAMSAANSARKGLQMDCPSCGSRDFTESAVLYTGLNPPTVPAPIAPCPLCRKPVSIEARKCPNCTGDIDPSESASMRASFKAAETTFNNMQKTLAERLTIQKALRKRTNLIIIASTLLMIGGAILLFSFINSLVLEVAMYGPMVFLVLYLVVIFSASASEKKGVVRFAKKQLSGA